VNVEIWSDIACPWCYIGKRRFESALARFDHAGDVTVTWRSFELDPDAPAEVPGDMAERIAQKYGVPVERAREMEDHVTAMAAAEGLDYRLDSRRAANSFDAHRLIHLAQESGAGDAMKERLMAAYFTQGELISDGDALARLGAEVGLDGDAVAEMLASDRFAEAVRADESAARAFGISGVPTFVVDRAIGVSGAQPPEVLLQLLQEGWARSGARPVIAAGEGESCGVDGC
jgi:predicted DsbA family dithiol-disulfide isomerase